VLERKMGECRIFVMVDKATHERADSSPNARLFFLPDLNPPLLRCNHARRQALFHREVHDHHPSIGCIPA
jgi:hypothetical protein